jgi:hypothetical protein
MKYVMFPGEKFILIPESQNHNDIIPSFTNPISAGFCRFYPNKNEWGEDIFEVEVWGKSESLKLNCRPEEDKYIIEMYMRKG